MKILYVSQLKNHFVTNFTVNNLFILLLFIFIIFLFLFDLIDRHLEKRSIHPSTSFQIILNYIVVANQLKVHLDQVFILFILVSMCIDLLFILVYLTLFNKVNFIFIISWVCVCKTLQ